jgi:hypothetical protein
MHHAAECRDRYATLLGRLTPAFLVSTDRDASKFVGSCFMRMAQAIHDGSFDFSAATVAAGEVMEHSIA